MQQPGERLSLTDKFEHIQCIISFLFGHTSVLFIYATCSMQLLVKLLLLISLTSERAFRATKTFPTSMGHCHASAPFFSKFACITRLKFCLNWASMSAVYSICSVLMLGS